MLRLAVMATGLFLVVAGGAATWWYLQAGGSILPAGLSGWSWQPLSIVGPSGSDDEVRVTHPSDRHVVPAKVTPSPPMGAETVAVKVARGRSVRGVPIPAFILGPAARPVTAMVVGVVHGDEPQGEYMSLKLLEHLLQQPAEAYATGRVIVVPVLNPDGKANRTRGNAHGVDLNRNLPSSNWRSSPKGRYWGGDQPNSEPETQLLLSLIQAHRPRHILAIHAPYHLINYDGPAKELAKALSQKNGYRVADGIGYPTYGSLGHYCAEQGIGIITLEVPMVSPEDAWHQNREALKAFCFASGASTASRESKPDSRPVPTGITGVPQRSSGERTHETQVNR